MGRAPGSEQETYWSLQDDSETEVGDVHAPDAKPARYGVQSSRCVSPKCSSRSGGVQDARECESSRRAVAGAFRAAILSPSAWATEGHAGERAAVSE